MTPERHAQIMVAFHRVADSDAGQRAALLDELSRADPVLGAEVESLLDFDRSNGQLTQPLLGNLGSSAAPPISRSNLPLPERIGRYEILDVLGWGGMGIVYRARQPAPDRVVALKVIRPDLASPTFRRRFQIEMETLARLRHPGIAAIHEAGTVSGPTGEQPYIAMEYVPGEPLLEHARKHGLDLGARVSLLVRLCEAVEHAHQHGVIHRDLKPANILVENVDGRPQPRILDFGVARLTTAEPAATLATQPGQLLGTLAYMSPEQMDGDPRAADTRSDVYSLGVLGYELLSGALPIDLGGLSVLAAMRALREQPQRHLATHGRALRGDLSTIIMKAAARDPAERYGSAAALSIDLARYAQGAPILAREPSVWYVLRRYAGRHRVVLGAAIVALAALLVGAGMTGFGLYRTRRANESLAAQFSDTLQTTAFLVKDVAGSLDTIVGTTPVRRQLLERLRSQIEHLESQRPDDLQLASAKANVLSLLADIQVADGNAEEARAARRVVLDLRRRIANVDPSAEHEADVSIALVKAADVFNGLHEFDDAERLWREALAIDLRLVARDPDVVRFVDNLAWSYDRLGNLCILQHRTSEAETLLLKAVEIRQRLLRIAPNRDATVHGLSQIHALLARLRATEYDDDQGAFQHSTSSRAYAAELAERYPQHPLYLFDYSCASLTLAQDQRKQGDTEAAAVTLGDTVRSARKLLELEPSSPTYRRHWAAVLLVQARFAVSAGNSEAALTLVDEAERELRKVPPLPLSVDEYGNLEREAQSVRELAAARATSAARGTPH